MAYTTIDDPSAYFKVQLYTGNGSANHAITFDDTDTDMQPDLVWIKNRDADDSHCLFDAVRGATKVMHSDASTAEATDTDTLDSFTSDGFQVDADVKVNTNTEKYVAWCWKESATAGFDIISYSGTGSAKTESHSLSAVPHVMIVKQRDDPGGGANAWEIYHHKNTSAPETEFMYWNETQATTDNAIRWNDTAPTSSVLTVGTGNSTNQSSSSFIGYLWTSIQGFSRMGIYTGNGNVDAPFVYTGFRPAWIMIKGPTQTQSWILVDTKRSPHNVVGNEELLVDNNNAENSDTWDPNTDANILDFLSNGFKLRHTATTGSNTAATPYIYMAFAEAPFVNSNGVPCNAR